MASVSKPRCGLSFALLYRGKYTQVGLRGVANSLQPPPLSAQVSRSSWGGDTPRADEGKRVLTAELEGRRLAERSFAEKQITTLIPRDRRQLFPIAATASQESHTTRDSRSSVCLSGHSLPQASQISSGSLPLRPRGVINSSRLLRRSNTPLQAPQ